MTVQKKGSLGSISGSGLRNIRILGCCNRCYDFVRLRPHEAGGYAAELLDRMGIYAFRAEGGINDSILNFRPTGDDLILLDDVGIGIGNFKIRRFSDYGKRGHNAVKNSLRSVKSNP